MKTTRRIFERVLISGIGLGCLISAQPVNAAESLTTVPAVIQEGFQTWAKKRAPSYVFDIWKKGGLLESDRKPSTLANYFGRLDRTIGNYKAFEVVDTKRISASSEIIYLSVNLEHAAAYGRFLMYRADKDWVVQNMDFSLKPEALMPWLAYTGDAEAQ